MNCITLSGIFLKLFVADDEDDSQEGRVKSGNEVVASIVNNAENDESLYRSVKNLLFVSEYSDEELSSNE